MGQTSAIEPTTLVQKPPVEFFDDTATLELLARWQLEDATSDPEQIYEAEQDLADFKKTMNENRVATGGPALYP